MIAGTTTIALMAVTVRQRAVRKPKSLKGPICEPRRTRKPPAITNRL